MPFALMFAGLLLTIAGVRNTQSDYNGQPGLYTLLKGDFTGDGNFAHWVLAIVGIGSLGYIDQLRTFSRYFLALIFLVLLLTKDKGFFDKFTSAVKEGLTPGNANKGASGVSAQSATGATGPNDHYGIPDFGISDLLKAGPDGQRYLQQLQEAWRHVGIS